MKQIVKQVIVKIRKRVHLFVFFLLLSSVPVFAQDLITYDIFVQQMSEDINKLNEILEKLTFTYELKKLSQEDIDRLFEEFKETYIDVRSKYLTYSEDLNIGASKEAIELSSFRYTHAYKEVPISITKKDEIMLSKELIQPWHTIEWRDGIGINNRNKYRKIIDTEIPLNEDFHNMRSYCLNDSEMQVFDDFFKYFNSRIREMSKVVDANKKIQNYLIRETMSPLQIMEYAFKNGMLPKEKAGVKLVLEAKDADVSVTTLVKGIRSYLTRFG
ncbi:MAG: hypothetical protein J5594_04385, partial [Elusimicrobiaceae bacterium]|nr:hypothetical protein [Elusimicrobiaceae bacterium]